MWSQHVAFWGLDVTLYQFIVLVVFVALLAGYLMAVLVNRRQRAAGVSPDLAQHKDRLVSNTAFIKGINYILTDKPDQAIEELTRAVNVDTDTIETYVALGNLFRSKGEIDRAVRIRQSIILRPDLDDKNRVQAVYDLGLDYLQGGLYERAVRSFEDVIRSDPRRKDAYVQLVRIYEDIRDWQKAFETQQKLAKLNGPPARNVQAHHQVEIGKSLFEKGLLAPAQAAYKKAIALDPGCVDAHLHQGDLLWKEGRPKKAIAAWRKVADVAPHLIYLVFGRLSRISAGIKDVRPVEEFLAECVADGRNAMANLALARLQVQGGKTDEALANLNRAIEIDPELYEAHREKGLILLAADRRDDALRSYQELLDHLAAPEADFECGQCGFVSHELTWRCPQCQTWDSMVLRRHHPILLERIRTAAAEPASPADVTPADDEA